MNLWRSLFSKSPEPSCDMASAVSVPAEDLQRIRQRVSELGPWFHNYEIAKNVWTNDKGASPGPDYPARRWKYVKPWFENLQGKSVLDVGCSSGFFSVKAAELGAESVLGVDSGEQVRAIAQAQFAADTLGLRAAFKSVSVYDVAQIGRTFDVVLCMGVFYHLRHPLLALEALRKVCRGTLILQTITVPHAGRVAELIGVSKDVQLNSTVMLDRRFPSMQFIEGGLEGDASCWFVPNVEAVAAMLRSCGFQPEHYILDQREILVRCRVTQAPTGAL
jgi:tRNA (mo5U34)-methyltransferase